MRKLHIISLSGLIAILILIGYHYIAFYKKEIVPFYEGSKKWSHRGWAKSEEKENSIFSIKKALDKGYGGVEIDVWFKDGVFFLTHDENYEESLANLEEVLKTFPDVKIWVDLKNLTIQNSLSVQSNLNKMDGKERLIIESQNTLALAVLKSNDLHTSLWIDPNNQFAPKIIYQKVMISMMEFDAVSMPAKAYLAEGVREDYQHLNIHLWNSISLKEIDDYEEVKILLDDDELH